MKIRIIAIGKIKEEYLKSGINMYLKRISPYCDIKIDEVNDEPVKDNPNASDIEIVKNKEGKKVIALIKDSDYLIGLDLNKKEYTSEEFSTYMENKFMTYQGYLTFVIGGSYGLSDELKNRCNDLLSFSKMTFLHQMTRLILLEQIYRSFKISRHEVYHK